MSCREMRGAARLALLVAVVLVPCLMPGCGPDPAPPAPAAPATRPAVTQGAQHNPPADHLKDRKGVRHKSGSKQATQNCSPCHGADLRGGAGPSCYTCHGQEWKG